jgi:hypothetical protein
MSGLPPPSSRSFIGPQRRASDRLVLWALILSAFLVLGLSVVCGTLTGHRGSLSEAIR